MKIKKLTLRTIKLALILALFGAFSSCTQDSFENTKDSVITENGIAERAPCASCNPVPLPNVYELGFK